jgi:hypothetical protein
MFGKFAYSFFDSLYHFARKDNWSENKFAEARMILEFNDSEAIRSNVWLRQQ